MENIIISKVCGICAGCSYAIQTTEKELQKNENVTLFKEIVHNNTVNKMLIDKGAKIKNEITDLTSNELVILRAHGEPPETYEYLNKNKIKFIDCTCARVKLIHEKVSEYSTKGYNIIIIGKYGKTSGKMHPEILGTIGWCNGKEILIEDEEDINKLTCYKNEKFYLTCQTTFNIQKADDYIEKIQTLLNKNNNELIVNKSICSAQYEINVASEKLISEVDFMIVVGSKKSSNTTELVKNLERFKKVIFIEDICAINQSLKDNNISLTKKTKIGLTAGASTLKSELESLKNTLQIMIDKL